MLSAITGKHNMPHDGHDHSKLSPIELRVRALESLLVEKGYVDPAAMDALIEAYETKIGPRNGAKVVARRCPHPHEVASGRCYWQKS